MREKFEKKIDFTQYSVILTNSSICYVFPNGAAYSIPTHFDIEIDDEKDGGKIEINFNDRFGSKMQFIHYKPSDMKGMFDFIGRGYKIFC
jgi:hypothetical protein